MFGLLSCSKKESSDVVVSFYALGELTNNLVKDTNINVTTLISGTSEPHEFEPTAQDVSKLYDASLIIFNGNNLEEFESSLDKDLKSKIVYATKDVEAIQVNGKNDPHSFVSPKELCIMLNTIKNSLVEKFSDQKNKIEENYESYSKELKSIDDKFQSAFENITTPMIVGHQAFNYVGRDYNQTFKAVSGIAEQEPTAKDISDMINYIKENNITKIYGEVYEENDTVNKIAKDAGVSVDYIYTLEMMGDENLTLVEALNKNIKALTA